MGESVPLPAARKLTVTLPNVCDCAASSCKAQFSQWGVSKSFRLSGGLRSTLIPSACAALATQRNNSIGQANFFIRFEINRRVAGVTGYLFALSNVPNVFRKLLKMSHAPTRDAE